MCKPVYPIRRTLILAEIQKPGVKSDQDSASLEIGFESLHHVDNYNWLMLFSKKDIIMEESKFRVS